jgi:hypothetical protein
MDYYRPLCLCFSESSRLESAVLAYSDVQKVGGFDTAQCVLPHEHLRRVLQAVLNQSPIRLSRNVLFYDKQWHNRKTNGKSPNVEIVASAEPTAA